jgi:phosphatidylinositol 4-kinase
MYSLLNYISATASNTVPIRDTNEPFFAAAASLLGTEESSSTNQSYYSSTVQSVRSGLQAMNEDQRRLIGISTISVVTRLAVEFDEEEVCISHVFV